MLTLELDSLSLDEIAHATTIRDGTVYVDGCLLDGAPDRLFLLENVFPADAFNAIMRGDDRAKSVVRSNGNLRRF